MTFENVDRHPATTNMEKKYHHFIFGLTHPENVRVQDKCANNALNALEFAMQPEDVLFSVLSLGLYTPQHAIFYCTRESTL